MNHASTEPFLRAFRGSFLGLRQWEDLDAFWETLKNHADDKWYVYATGESAPAAPLSKEQLILFINEIDALLRREHQEEYCGIVYVDDKDEPGFIKIYDPNNLGVVCGYSNNPPLPGWIISRLPPVELTKDTFLPQSRKRWWQRLFSAG
ncbi:MAG: hypothetical protein L0Z73_14120 [Gammaproteobacteria bacterium]|nr:hypothetical protein [Gammaproteobacteria bacterium]